MLNCCCFYLRKSSRQKDEKATKDAFPIQFAVRSLGWVEIAEDDLTPERSSKAVNKCIVDLSLGRNDINDVVGRWGDVSDVDVNDKSADFIFSAQCFVHTTIVILTK